MRYIYFLLALFLALEKRKAELRMYQANGILTREVLSKYSIPILLRLESIVSTGSFITYALWALQLCLNTLWTPVFFGAYDLLGALVLILFLWITILCYTVSSYKIDKIASYLFMPYLAWVSFATVLNFEYLRIN